jgi:endonuclease/exonuclease/phosphatase (EEP) superfamily protein YafD
MATLADPRVEVRPAVGAEAVSRPPRKRGAARLAVAIALTWTAFVGVHLALTGRWWVWALVGLLPPLTFLVVPVALAGTLAAVRSRSLLGWTGVVVSLLLGLGQSGVAWPRLHAAAPTFGAIRVVAWNTEYWDQGESSGAFYRFLARQRADVYVLQEYGFWDGHDIRAIDRARELRTWFPGYRVAVSDDMLTLSRFPVSRRRVVVREGVLRTDLATPEGDLSVYNVHLKAPYDLSVAPWHGSFWRALRGRAEQRHDQVEALSGDVRANSAPLLLAGDFNTTPAMGQIGPLRSRLTDAAQTSGVELPRTWTGAGLRLWRLDWDLLGNGARASRFDISSSRGHSDHALQSFTVHLPRRGRTT